MKIDTGFATRCNNDHGISPDATQLAISDNSQDDHESLVYIVPIAGGTPRRITQKSPSYWHGWSPDGKTLAFVGQRNGDFDIYAIPAAGGEETRLTTAKGLDDGPEYSPDGKYIYFNSERTGHMQIWRMKPDGSEQEQVFSDDLNNWFPHISPDGQWMVFLTYGADVTGHPENKDVMLRLMSLAGQEDHRAGEVVRRAGNHQRSVVVARQQEIGVRELHACAGRCSNIRQVILEFLQHLQSRFCVRPNQCTPDRRRRLAACLVSQVAEYRGIISDIAKYYIPV